MLSLFFNPNPTGGGGGVFSTPPSWFFNRYFFVLWKIIPKLTDF